MVLIKNSVVSQLFACYNKRKFFDKDLESLSRTITYGIEENVEHIARSRE
jgi:hypothetical protein